MFSTNLVRQFSFCLLWFDNGNPDAPYFLSDAYDQKFYFAKDRAEAEYIAERYFPGTYTLH